MSSFEESGSMGRSLSPALRQELENLDRDGDSRKSAIKALKSYVKDLDTTAIPIFLAKVSETKQNCLSSGEHTVSLYEVLARVHGTKIVPQIDNIMSSVVKTLYSSAGSFPLHQACSKVVPAIARYAIDPSTPSDKKIDIIRSLCKPLLDSLLASQENLSSGAALCLQALVESDNWRFASNELVNEVCQKVAAALEKHTQTNYCMALVTALAKHNCLIVEAYSRLLIRSGLRILEAGTNEANSQKQFSAIHMVSSLLRFLDPRSIWSELELVITEMEKCQVDRMPFVIGAAFEALQIAKKIYAGNCSKINRSEELSLTASPESQTVDSFIRCDLSAGSPNSINQGHPNLVRSCRSVNRRKLWQNFQGGLVDVSLEDGILSDITGKSGLTSPDYGDEYDCHDHTVYPECFAGFDQDESNETPCQHHSNPHIKVEDVKIFSTPRRLIRSLQDSNSRSSGKRNRKIWKVSGIPKPILDHNCLFYPEDDEGKPIFDHDSLFYTEDAEAFHTSESVSSTDEVPANGKDPSLSAGREIQLERVAVEKSDYKLKWRIVCGFVLFLFAGLVSLLANSDSKDSHILTPT